MCWECHYTEQTFGTPLSPTLPVIINQLYSSAFLYSSTFKDRAIDWPHVNSPGQVCWPSTPDISDIMIVIFQNGLLSVYTQQSSTDYWTCHKKFKRKLNREDYKGYKCIPNFVTTHITTHSCKQHVHVHHLYLFSRESWWTKYTVAATTWK